MGKKRGRLVLEIAGLARRRVANNRPQPVMRQVKRRLVPRCGMQTKGVERDRPNEKEVDPVSTTASAVASSSSRTRASSLAEYHPNTVGKH